MSLSSLVAAAQTAVEMSEAAAAAAEDAMHAAKLAGVHAQAALAAAKLAVELEQNVKKEKDEKSTSVDLEIASSAEIKDEIEKNSETKLRTEEKYEEGNGTKTEKKSEKQSLKKSGKVVCDNCKLHTSQCLNGRFLLKVTDRTKGMKMKTHGGSWDGSRLGNMCIVRGGDMYHAKIQWISSDGEKKEELSSPIVCAHEGYMHLSFPVMKNW